MSSIINKLMRFFKQKIFKNHLMINISNTEEESPVPATASPWGPHHRSGSSRIEVSVSDSCFPLVAKTFRRQKTNFAYNISISDPTEMSSLVVEVLKFFDLLKKQSDNFIDDMRRIDYVFSSNVNEMVLVKIPLFDNSEIWGRDTSLLGLVDTALENSVYWYNLIVYVKVAMVCLAIMATICIGALQFFSHMTEKAEDIAFYMSLFLLSVFGFTNSVCNSYLESYEKEAEIFVGLEFCLKLVQIQSKQIQCLNINVERVNKYLKMVNEKRLYSEESVKKYLKEAGHKFSDWLKWLMDLKNMVDQFEDSILNSMLARESY